MGHAVFSGGTLGWIMVHLLAITVLTSASASTQTTILPTARTSLSMAAFKAIRGRFARIHPKYLTPTDSTIWMGGVSIVFYYGLIGFACVWFYRKTMWEKPRDILMQGIIPFLGGLLLLGFFLVACKTYSAKDYGYTHIGAIDGVFVIGIGSLLLGVVLMVIYERIAPCDCRTAGRPP